MLEGLIILMRKVSSRFKYALCAVVILNTLFVDSYVQAEKESSIPLEFDITKLDELENEVLKQDEESEVDNEIPNLLTEEITEQNSTLVAQGTHGTAPWTLTNDGYLTIGSGHLQGATIGAGVTNASSWSPWNSHIRRVEFTGPVTANSLENTFYNCSNLTEIIGIENLDTRNVTTMRGMFNACGLLTKLDLSSWNTASVTDMSLMFSTCRNLSELNISGWNTRELNVTTSMFMACGNLVELDVSEWITTNLTNTANMFLNCFQLEELDVSNWDMSNLKNSSIMFAECRNLTTLEVGEWNCQNLQTIDQMFRGCHNIVELDVSNWNTSNVTSFQSVFANCRNITFLNLSNWDTSSGMNFSGMFSDCINLEELDLSGWSVNNATNKNNMFLNCTNLKTLHLNEEFKFTIGATSAQLPNITNSNYSGAWIGINNGIRFISSADLMQSYSGEADTYIWEEKPWINVTLPMTMMFNPSSTNTSLLVSREYSIMNHSSVAIEVSAESVQNERNIESIQFLILHALVDGNNIGANLISSGNPVANGARWKTIQSGDQLNYDLIGGTLPVIGEVNPYFEIIFKFSPI